MACSVCDQINGKETKKIYEDNTVIAMLSEKSAVPGHMIIAPKKHHTIFEQVPPETLANISNVANKLSLILVQGLKVAGTNVIMNNGVSAGQKVPHYFVDLIPRYENDGQDFSWQGNQADDSKLTELQEKITNVLEKKDEEEPSQPAEKEEESSEDENSDFTEEEEDYLLRSIDRIP